MFDQTDQLVVLVTAMDDRVEAARLTLQTLESRAGDNAALAHNAVVIVSESTDATRGKKPLTSQKGSNYWLGKLSEFLMIQP